VLLPDADVWFGYTQQSLWQVWNPRESAPFRNTDFEPEVIYVVPVPQGLRALPGGWDFRMVQLGLAHQSNGQAEPLSRSWNRVYLAAGLEKGELSVYARMHKRLREDPDDNDNPDLTRYVGRGDIAVAWLPGRATASLRWRTNLRDFKRGSWQFDWTYPVDTDKPDGLRWYVQGFTGYGETLLDYNHQQTSLGVGLTLFEF
jgi:phospholipase A1